MSIHCAIGHARPGRSVSPILSERDAWVRMPAMKSPCGACTAAMPCPKGRATSLFQRHRAARASLTQPMRIRPTKHRTSARPPTPDSYQLSTMSLHVEKRKEDEGQVYAQPAQESAWSSTAELQAPVLPADIAHEGL